MRRSIAMVVLTAVISGACSSASPASPSASTAASSMATVAPSLAASATPSPSPSASSIPSPSPSPDWTPLVPSTYTRSTAGRRSGDSSTENWAGYTATNHGRPFDRVEAQWTVTTVDCANASSSSGVGEVVGLNGGFDHPGTAAYLFTLISCEHESGPAEVLWQTPNDDGDLGVIVNVGDQVYGSVEIEGDQVSFSLVDQTTNDFDSVVTSGADVSAKQAVWTVSVEGCTSTACPALPKFGPITMAQALARSMDRIGSINDPAWASERIEMTDHSHKVVRAEASALTVSGSRFTVRWIRK
jgi:hypothetical protein